MGQIWPSQVGHARASQTIANDTATLTIFEAVMVRDPVSWKKVQDDLTNHFIKLFSYGACPAYFHVTYLMTGELVNAVEQLKVIAEKKAPKEFTFVDLDVLPFVDSGPSGFSATYRSGRGDRQIHFLVLDLSMEVENNAAKEADRYRPKRKTGPAGKKENVAAPSKRESCSNDVPKDADALDDS